MGSVTSSKLSLLEALALSVLAKRLCSFVNNLIWRQHSFSLKFTVTYMFRTCILLFCTWLFIYSFHTNTLLSNGTGWYYFSSSTLVCAITLYFRQLFRTALYIVWHVSPFKYISLFDIRQFVMNSLYIR